MKSSPIRRTKEEIDELLRELEKSGETVVEFAKRHGFSAQTVYAWKKGRKQGAEQTRRDLVRVMVGEPEPSISIGYELVVHGAGTIRIPPGFDEGDLVRLLRALRERC